MEKGVEVVGACIARNNHQPAGPLCKAIGSPEYIISHTGLR
jgi:hypothetical protein